MSNHTSLFMNKKGGGFAWFFACPLFLCDRDECTQLGVVEYHSSPLSSQQQNKQNKLVQRNYLVVFFWLFFWICFFVIVISRNLSVELCKLSILPLSHSPKSENDLCRTPRPFSVPQKGFGGIAFFFCAWQVVIFWRPEIDKKQQKSHRFALGIDSIGSSWEVFAWLLLFFGRHRSPRVLLLSSSDLLGRIGLPE